MSDITISEERYNELLKYEARYKKRSDNELTTLDNMALSAIDTAINLDSLYDNKCTLSTAKEQHKVLHGGHRNSARMAFVRSMDKLIERGIISVSNSGKIVCKN